VFSKDNFWFAGLKGAFKTPTWRVLLSSLFFVFIYYGVLYILASRFVNFDFHIPGYIVYSLGYVIAILFYFRLNNSYYRWYDGNKSLAYLKANADAFSMKSSTYLRVKPGESDYLNIMMKNFCRGVRDIVRNFQDAKAMIEAEPGMIKRLENVYHLPNQINTLLGFRINNLYQDGLITKMQFLDLNRNLIKNSELLSSAETLKTTPPPKIYIIHIRGFLLSYMFMIPFGFIHEFGVWMLLFLLVFFYFYTGLEIISEEIEDPFGFDMNDLPVEPITMDIENRIDANSKT
jgi:putative membrane protein